MVIVLQNNVKINIFSVFDEILTVTEQNKRIDVECSSPESGYSSREKEAFEKCWAHSPLRAVLHCHSPGVTTVTRCHCCTPPAHRCP